MNDLKKDVCLLKTIISSVLALTGLITIVFAILSLAKVSSLNPNVALRYIAGGALIISGGIILILNYVKQPHKIDIRDVLLGSLVVGLGIFLMLEEGNSAIKSIITLILPMGLACAGGGILIKGLIAILTLKSAKPEELKGLKLRCIFAMFFGAIFVTVGTLFCAFREKEDLINVVWLIAGLLISCLSFIVLINSTKDLKTILKKEKSESNVNSTKKEDVKEIEIVDKKEEKEDKKEGA